MASGNGKRKRDGAVILPFGMPKARAQQLIRELVAAGEFVLVPKAKTNLRDRQFTMRQVLAALKEGEINEGPWKDECHDWRCRLRKRCAGRLIRVVAAIHDETFVYVISVH